jgi:hypothetical protein
MSNDAHGSNRYLKALLPAASLTLSAASLGVGTANFLNSKRNVHASLNQNKSLNAQTEAMEQQRKIEEKSLSALRAIHKSLAAPAATNNIVGKNA